MSKVLTKSATFIAATRHDGSVKAWSLIDAEEYEWAKEHRWHQSTEGDFRRNRWPEPGTISLHREIMGLERYDTRVVDHINRDNTDNRRSNLRVVSKGQNGQNRKPVPGTSSQYRGVTWTPSIGKWRGKVQSRVLGKSWSKQFDDELEAAEWAREKRAEVLPYSVEQ